MYSNFKKKTATLKITTATLLMSSVLMGFSAVPGSSLNVMAETGAPAVSADTLYSSEGGFIKEAENNIKENKENTVNLTASVLPIDLQQKEEDNSMATKLVSVVTKEPVAQISVRESNIVGQANPITIEPLIIPGTTDVQCEAPGARTARVTVMADAQATLIEALDNSALLADGPNSDRVEAVNMSTELVPIEDDEVYDVYEVIVNGVSGGYEGQVLLDCVNPDPNYVGQPLNLTGANRENFERLVMGEAGDEGYEGAALVAQALKDTMLMVGDTNTLSIKSKFKYSGRLNKAPNEDVRRACEFVLNGGSAVQHRVIYFYAPHIVRSKFHETQEFVIEWGGHRVFDKV